MLYPIFPFGGPSHYMPIASHFPSVSFHRARRGIAVLVLAAVSPALSWAAPADPAAPVAAATAPSAAGSVAVPVAEVRSEEHKSELQSLMRISYAGFCLKNNKQ